MLDFLTELVGNLIDIVSTSSVIGECLSLFPVSLLFYVFAFLGILFLCGLIGVLIELI